MILSEVEAHKIVTEVAKVASVPEFKIYLRYKQNKYVYPRHIIINLLINNSILTRKSIGFVVMRHYSTVINSNKVVPDLYKHNREFRELMDRCVEAVKPLIGEGVLYG